VATLKRDGIHLSTPETLQRRLEDRVAAGELRRDVADQVYDKSPFHGQLEVRSGKFWMSSHPVAVDDSGVEPLMKHWGGEVASKWIRNEPLSASLEPLGKPRIIEVAVPLCLCANADCYHAGSAVVATFARSRGSIPKKHDFDVCLKQPLSPRAILAVHSEGDRPFAEMGRRYPIGGFAPRPVANGSLVSTVSSTDHQLHVARKLRSIARSSFFQVFTFLRGEQVTIRATTLFTPNSLKICSARCDALLATRSIPCLVVPI
jgi:hypothetical protein